MDKIKKKDPTFTVGVFGQEAQAKKTLESDWCMGWVGVPASHNKSHKLHNVR